MSKFDSTIDSEHMICPYCGHEHYVEAEDYSESGDVETCDDCGMKFHGAQSFSVDHTAKPDCELNEKQHQWEMIQLRDGKSHEFCSECGKCKPFEKAEKHG